MAKNKTELSFREQSIMDLLWENSTGLTSVDILEQLNDVMGNATYVHRTLNSLISKGFITECGSVRYNKQYARKFTPSLTKEEYIANMLIDKNININSLSGIALAFVRQKSESSANHEKFINELKKIIDEMEGDM